MGSVYVLGNPEARGGTGDTELVINRVRAAGHQVTVLQANSPEGAAAQCREAVESGADRLIVVGGDGLVRIAVDAVAESSTILGIVPQGTGNDFARALGLLDGSLDDHVDRALAVAAEVDAIRTNHGWAASVATMGFAGDVTEWANRLRWPRGQQRYTLATLLQLPRLRKLAVKIEVDGETHETVTTMLSIGNTAYFGGGMNVCPGAKPDDGQAQVVVVGPASRSTFLRVFPKVFSGRHIGHPQVTTYRGSKVTVDGDPAMMWADGDELGPLPVTCEIVSGAVAVAGAVTNS